ncbi:MAG TPA: protein phosphatase CheZ [Sphingomonadales bacterium]
MSEAQGLALEQRVEALVEQTGGQVEVSDIAGVVTSIMQSWKGSFSLHELHVRDEIRDLLTYVQGAMRELADLRPRALSAREIPDASNQLDAIVAATEEAAEKMMDVAEEIEALANTTGAANDDFLPRMTGIATRIYEASSFQDITGQRISKVMRILQHLEQKLGSLAETLGDEDTSDDAPAVDPLGEIDDPKALLHGPQLPTEANSQDDIDALLASFD